MNTYLNNLTLLIVRNFQLYYCEMLQNKNSESKYIKNQPALQTLLANNSRIFTNKNAKFSG